MAVCVRERARERESNRTCCVAIVGDDVLIEPQTVRVFRPEVSFKTAMAERNVLWAHWPLALDPIIVM